jgi:hypothetical protein
MFLVLFMPYGLSRKRNKEILKKEKSKVVLLFSLVILAISRMAFVKEGGAGKAGKKIEKAFNAA